MEPATPDLFQYTNYRKYLRDYYQFKKAQAKSFSFQNFAKKAKISSSGFLLHVMNGERNLTKPVLLRVAQALELDRSQTEYFENLVAFDQAKTQVEKDFYYGKSLAVRQTARVKNLADSQYVFFSEWYHSMVRELVSLMPRNSAPAELAKMVVPQISTAQAKSSLRLMEDLEILKKDASAGGYALTEPFIGGSATPIRSLAVTRFQKSMLEIAQQAWENFKENEILMSTVTFTMSEELVQTINREIREFKNRVLSLVQNETKPATRVYHLNLHFFPTSKRVGENRK